MFNKSCESVLLLPLPVWLANTQHWVSWVVCSCIKCAGPVPAFSPLPAADFWWKIFPPLRNLVHGIFAKVLTLISQFSSPFSPIASHADMQPHIYPSRCGGICLFWDQYNYCYDLKSNHIGDSNWTDLTLRNKLILFAPKIRYSFVQLSLIWTVLIIFLAVRRQSYKSWCPP